MNRRSFLTNSIAALLGVALTSNKALATIVQSIPDNSPKVLLYLIQNNKRQWKVRGTKWIDVAKKRLDVNKVLIETFKPLEIIDNDIANQRRNELWKIHKCSGEKGGPLNVVIAQQRAKKAHISLKMIAYVNSEQHKINFEKGREKGTKLNNPWSLALGKRNVETGHLLRIRPENYADNFKNFTKQQRSDFGKKGGKAAFKVNFASGQIMKAQAKMAESRRKKVIDTSTGIIYVSLKEVAKTFNLHYGSLKNQLNENHRKNKTKFLYLDKYKTKQNGTN